MDQKLVTLLRQRIASRYYDRAEVIDALARAILAAQPLSDS